MQYAAGPPSHWLIELKAGARMDLWVDAFSLEDGYYLFGVLVDATPEEVGAVSVTSWPSPRPDRAEMILVAKIPETAVVRFESAPPFEQDQAEERV